jgi:hypothetical protein
MVHALFSKAAFENSNWFFEGGRMVLVLTESKVKVLKSKSEIHSFIHLA